MKKAMEDKQKTTGAPEAENPAPEAEQKPQTEAQPEAEPEVEVTVPDAEQPSQEEWAAALKKAVEERDSYKDSYLRAQSEFQNFKRRNATARADAYQDGTREAIAACLPAIDNLELALRHAEEAGEKGAMYEGVKMTLKLMLEACAKAGIAVTVLDRPIPLGGIVDGPMRNVDFASFVAPLNVPFCHGMTPAECAKYIVREELLDVDLTVIKMRDWSHTNRTPWFDFMPPSPAIRSWDSAALYPATVFTEAYPAIDCDRDGALAFRVVGAPWLDIANLLEDFMDPLPACGMGVRPIRYRPVGGKYAGQTINGLLLSVENPDAFYPVTAGSIILAALLHRHGDEMAKNARPEWLDKLVGSTGLRDAIANKNLSDLFQSWIDAQDVYLPTKVDLYA